MAEETEHTAPADESISKPTGESGKEAISFWLWVISCSVLLGLCASVDLGLGGEGRSVAALFWISALGCATGLLHGAFLGGAFRLLRGRRRLVQAFFWTLLASLAVFWPMEELGVLARLQGEYQHLAILTLVGLLAVGAAAVVLFILLQPTARLPRGWLGARSRRVRLTVASGLLMTAIVTAILDRNFYEGGYSIAHLFLEVGGLWCLFLSVPLLWERTPQPTKRVGLAYVAVVLGLFVVTVTTLTSTREGELNVMLDRPYAALALETGRGLFDYDLDGYSNVLAGGDCKALSSDVNPGEAEIPGNGLDDNCRLGDAPVGSYSLAEVTWPKDPSSTSVVLITVDTLAAPYMSLYDAHDKTSPGIDAWARRASVFERAYTSGGWTSLAISSMMRGVYPRRLKWTRLFETSTRRLLTTDQVTDLRQGETVEAMFGLPLDDPRITLPTWLSLRGMTTSAVVNDGQSEFLDPLFQKKGFDHFIDMDTRVSGRRATDKEVTAVAKKALDGLAGKAPFFLWVHYFGPHGPDTAHRDVPRFGNDRVGKYKHEIAALDKEVTLLLRTLDALAKKRKLAVILTSDHGEVISATGRGHGREPLEDAIRIPLVIKAPGFTAGRYESVVSLVDIYPTIAALTNSPMPLQIAGVDLARVVAGDPEMGGRTLIAETWRYGRDGQLRSEHVAAFDGKRKLTIDMRNQARTVRDQIFPEKRKQNLLNDPTQHFDALEEALARHLEAGSSATFVR